MNNTFLITAVIYVLLRAFVMGYGWWRECVKTGYNPKFYERTGEKVPFYGGFSEGLLNSPVFTLIALISPKHLLIRFLEVISAYALYAMFAVPPITLFPILFIASVWLENKRTSNVKPFPENGSAEEKREWFSSTAPWHKISPKITNALIEKFGDDPMLVLFVITSMEHNLVARYNELENEEYIDDTDVVCAQIAVMFCLLGNASVRAMVELMQGNPINQTKLKHHYQIVLDTLETTIILDQNQIQAYLGLATVYALLDKTEGSLKLAKQGLSKLQELKENDSFSAFSGAVPNMAQTMDEMEKALEALIQETS